MNKKVLILLAVVWTAALGLVGFSELRPEDTAGNAQKTQQEASTNSAEQETAARESTEREPGGQKTAKRQTAGGSNNSGSNSGGSETDGVTLQVGGEAGIEFSGRCTVDGEERELGGQTPQTYTYEPEERLECEISSRDRGPLRVTFSDGGGKNTTQQVGPGPGSLELTYTGNGLSTSTSSQSGASQVSSSRTNSSQTSSSQTDGSQISSSQSSSQTSSSVTQSGSE